MKILQIGFNRCGTEALHQFFVANGVPSVHWDQGQLAVRMFRALLFKEPLFSDYEAFSAFFDMEFLSSDLHIEAFKYFPALYRANPEAVFLLNTRSRESWIDSRLRHAQGTYAQMHMHVLGVSEPDLVEHWKGEWDRHHARVRKFFANQGRLVEFNIETDGPKKLVEALPELTLDPHKYRRLPNRAARLLPYSRFNRTNV